MRSALRVRWFAYGSLEQPTGGYVYDRLVVSGLRAAGHAVEVVDPRAAPARLEDPEVVVGDALCVPELGPLFEELHGMSRVLLVHHLTSWEVERTDRAPLRALEERVVRATDRLVATGPWTARRLGLEFPGRAVDVVVPGADRLPRMERRARLSGVPLRLLLVGSLIPRKRVPSLLDAMEGVEAVASGRVSLTLVGDPSRDRGHATAICQRIDDSPLLRGRVTLAGVLDEPSLARALAGADALILPSSLEGYGMVLTEALHAGLPVVAACQAASAAALEGHPAVLTFGDDRELRGLLGRLADEPRLLARLEAAARDTDLPRWSATIASFGESLALAVTEGRARGPGHGPPP